MAFPHDVPLIGVPGAIGPVTQHLQKEKEMATAMNSLVCSKCQLFKVSKGKSAEISG